MIGQLRNNDRQKDSTSAKVYVDFSARLQEYQRQALTDSIRRVQVEKELSELKDSERQKRAKLEQQLNRLKEEDVTRMNRRKADIDSLRKISPGYPVYGFFGDTLFIIYSSTTQYSSAKRAEDIQRRIRKLGGKFDFNPDSLKIVYLDQFAEIVYGDEIILSISETDEIWYEAPRTELANRCLASIRNSLVEYKKETSFREIAFEIVQSLLVIFFIALIIKLSGKLFAWLAERIKLQQGKRFRGYRIKNYHLLDAGDQVRVILYLITMLKWLLILLVIYLGLPVLFALFPWTRHFTGTLFSYILDPVRHFARGVWNYLPNLITILVIIILFNYFLRVLRFFKREIEYEKLRLPGFFPEWASPTYHIIRLLTLAFMLIIIFPYLPGSNSPIFQGVSVFLGVLLTFGSMGSLSNLISGIVLTYMRLYKTGDRIKIGNDTGDVVEKSLLVTRIRTIKNEIISIPNSTVINNPTVNFSTEAGERGLILFTTVTIGYGVPWKDMHQALIDAALQTRHILHDPPPFVLQTGLNDFYVSYQINAYTREATLQQTIYSELHQHIQDVCAERGIEIMSPHYAALRDGNTSTIPENFLPKGYTSPGLRMDIRMDQDRKND